MMGKHTVGPWVVGQEVEVHGFNYTDIITDPKRLAPKHIALVDHIGGPDEESLHNAYLIAAAPQMLEALEYIQREMFKSDPDKTQMAWELKKAIDMARGEL